MSEAPVMTLRRRMARLVGSGTIATLALLLFALLHEAPARGGLFSLAEFWPNSRAHRDVGQRGRRGGGRVHGARPWLAFCSKD